MKKLVTKMIPLTLLVLALCMTSVAVSANVTINEETLAYNGETVSVDVTADAAGQVVVLVVDGDHESQGTSYIAGLPTTEGTEGNLQSQIVYVDQASSAKDASTNFTFIPNTATKAGNTVTLYASGTDATAVDVATLSLKDTYTITYDAAGGTMPAGAYVTKYQEGATDTLPVPTKIGGTFKGWLVNGAGSPIETLEGQTGNLNLTASWEMYVVTDSTDYKASATAPDGMTALDGGVYTNEEEELGVLSVTAWVNKPEDVTKFGFVVLADKTLHIDPVAATLDANGFYTVVYNIPKAKFGENITFKPYVVVGDAAVASNWYYGEAIAKCVNDFATNNLGTAAELGFIAE